MSDSETSNELAELRTIAALAGRIHLSTLPAEIADPLRAALVHAAVDWRNIFASVRSFVRGPCSKSVEDLRSFGCRYSPASSQRSKEAAT